LVGELDDFLQLFGLNLPASKIEKMTEPGMWDFKNSGIKIAFDSDSGKVKSCSKLFWNLGWCYCSI